MSTKSTTPRTDAFLRSQAPFTRDDVRKILESLERSLAAKETEVERLREWRLMIIKTGWLMHFEHCASSDIAPRSAVKGCDCGLDAALSGD